VKSLLRNFLINLVAIYTAARLIPGFQVTGGIRSFVLGAIGLMLLNMFVVPLLKITFLPLNLLTLGLFAWVLNVVALYALTSFLPDFKLVPYDFAGANIAALNIPSQSLSVLEVAILTSFLVGFISHFLLWLAEK
jgi:putative membrane protein